VWGRGGGGLNWRLHGWLRNMKIKSVGHAMTRVGLPLCGHASAAFPSLKTRGFRGKNRLEGAFRNFFPMNTVF
jgi:hypothetical protein